MKKNQIWDIIQSYLFYNMLRVKEGHRKTSSDRNANQIQDDSFGRAKTQTEKQQIPFMGIHNQNDKETLMLNSDRSIEDLGKDKKRSKILDTDGEYSRARLLESIAKKIKQVKMNKQRNKMTQNEKLKAKVEELEQKIRLTIEKKQKRANMEDEKFLYELMEGLGGLPVQGKQIQTPSNESGSWLSHNLEAFTKKQTTENMTLTSEKSKKQMEKKEFRIRESPNLKRNSEEGRSLGNKPRVTFTYTSPSPQPRNFPAVKYVAALPIFTRPLPKQIATPLPKPPSPQPPVQKTTLSLKAPARAFKCPNCGRNCPCRVQIQRCTKCGRKCRCPPYHRLP